MATFIRLLDPAGLPYVVEEHQRSWRAEPGPDNVTTEALVVVSSIDDWVWLPLRGIDCMMILREAFKQHDIPYTALPTATSDLVRVLKPAKADIVLDDEFFVIDEDDAEILALLRTWAKRFPEGTWNLG